MRSHDQCSSSTLGLLSKKNHLWALDGHTARNTHKYSPESDGPTDSMVREPQPIWVTLHARGKPGPSSVPRFPISHAAGPSRVASRARDLAVRRSIYAVRSPRPVSRSLARSLAFPHLPPRRRGARQLGFRAPAPRSAMSKQGASVCSCPLPPPAVVSFAGSCCRYGSIWFADRWEFGVVVQEGRPSRSRRPR